ncbi:MAG: OsmC family protein [Propionibacterium sp.]|nr:OsmC family protein [Propionibacterium sp.]
MKPPTSYRVQAHVTAGGVATVTAGNQTIPVDATWAADEPPGTPGPAELLAAAFAACLMKNLERSSALLSFRYEHADIDVRARRQDIPPQFVELEYEVRLVTDEDERRVDLVHRNLRQFGTVYNTLAAVCDVHGRVVVVPATADPPAR